MSHFHFNLRSLFAPPVARHESWRRSLDELPANEDVELTKGPGWFDSSWDLRRGLEVREGLPGDAQLHEWLEVWLRDDRASAAAPRPARNRGALRASAPVVAEPPDAFDAFGIEGLALA